MAIDFSQVTSIQIPNCLYRELEYIATSSINSHKGAVTICNTTTPSSSDLTFQAGCLYSLIYDDSYYQAAAPRKQLFGYLYQDALETKVSTGMSVLGGELIAGSKTTNNQSLGAYTNSGGIREAWLKLNSDGSYESALSTLAGTAVLGPVTGGSSNNLAKLFYLGYYRSSGGGDNYTDMRIYRFRVYTQDKQGALISDMVPCQRKSDNVIGLYDVIRDVFYPRDGTVIAADIGPVVNENPTWAIFGSLTVIKIEDANGVVLWPTSITPVAVDLWEWDSSIQWTVGTGVQNTDGYTYYPITASGGQKGVQIAIADNPDGIPSDGKFPSRGLRTWKVKFPEAGWYQMVMTCSYSSSGANQVWSSWKIFGIDGITVNDNRGSWTYTDPDYNIDIKVFKTSHEDEYHTVTYPDTGAEPACAFSALPNFQQGVMAQIVTCLLYCDDATVEHSITFADNGYRCVFDTASNIIFRKVPYDPSQYTPNS